MGVLAKGIGHGMVRTLRRGPGCYKSGVLVSIYPLDISARPALDDRKDVLSESEVC